MPRKKTVPVEQIENPIARNIPRHFIPIDPNYAWYAVRCQIKCEERVMRGMEAAGIVPYVPYFRQVAVVRRKPVERDVTATPRYLFAGLPKEAPPFGTLAAVNGVEAILGAYGKPFAIPVSVLAELENRLSRGDSIYDLVGREFEITTGLLRGFVAKVISILGENRVEIETAVFGNSRVSIDIDQLAA